MFGNDINKFRKEREEEEILEIDKEKEELEEYLKARNAAIGEKTKSIAESEEDLALEAYKKLRNRTIGDTTIVSYEGKKSKNGSEDTLESYLKERNAALNEDLETDDESESELDAYIRKRREIMDE